MPVFVSLGRYSENAIKGMLAKPEDRSASVAKLIEQAGGKLIGSFASFAGGDNSGEFPFWGKDWGPQ